MLSIWFVVNCIFIDILVLVLKKAPRDSRVLEAAWVSGLMTMAFHFGVSRSLACIRRKALTDQAGACVVTANAAFTTLGAALAGGIILKFVGIADWWSNLLAGLIVSLCILFCIITRREFMKIGNTGRAAPRGFEVVFPLQPAPPKGPE